MIRLLNILKESKEIPKHSRGYCKAPQGHRQVDISEMTVGVKICLIFLSLKLHFSASTQSNQGKMNKSSLT